MNESSVIVCLIVITMMMSSCTTKSDGLKIPKDAQVVFYPDNSDLQPVKLGPRAAARIIHIVQGQPSITKKQGAAIGRFRIGSRTFEWYPGALELNEAGTRFLWEDPVLKQMADTYWEDANNLTDTVVRDLLAHLEDEER